MSRLVGLQIPFHNHHNIEHLSKLLMPESHLIQVGLSLFINRRGLQVCRWAILIVQLLALCAPWSTTGIRASIGEIQRRIMPQL